MQNAPFITLVSVRFRQELEWYRTMEKNLPQNITGMVYLLLFVK